MKKIRLRQGLSHEEITEMAEETLIGHGYKRAQIGDKMPDGTIYAGHSPDTGKNMYAMPTDAPQGMTSKQAKDYAAKLDAHGHQDWRVPTKAELNTLFEYSDFIGGFNLSGSDWAGSYWSATPYTNSPECIDKVSWCQRFSDGRQTGKPILDPLSVRCVR